jgi:carboxypeptidase T
MKRLFLISLLIVFLAPVFAQDNHWSQVKIYLGSHSLANLARLGIPVDEGQYRPGGSFTTVITDESLRKISGAGFRCEILRADYDHFINERNKSLAGQVKEINEKKQEWYGKSASTYTVPQGFHLGSMGGFYTWDEVQSELDSLSIKYPNLVTVKAPATSGTSLEGRSLYYVKISKNPNINENEPKILYDGLHHAREPIGMQQLFFFVNYLLENYTTDPEVQYMLDHSEIFFLPVVNPDGYEYNHSTDPYGGGQWRKNRRNNGTSYGVDINRNYGFEWGYDDVGSSPFGWDETYRGTAPFSEPETQIVRDFSVQHNFTMALNDHSYAGLFIYPWSYITEDDADSTKNKTWSKMMTRDNSYIYGTPGAVLYNTNGDANDWMYGEQVLKPKVYAYTPEIGNDNDGFWPLPERIIPLCQESMLMDKLATLLCLKYAEATDTSSPIVPTKQGYLKFNIERYGLDSTGTYTVSIQPLDANLVSVGSGKVFQGMGLFEVRADSISYQLDPGITTGTSFKYLLQVNNGHYTHSDTLTKWYGQPLTVFSDICSNMTNWTSTTWNTTFLSYHSAPYSIADSPFGNYDNNVNSNVAMINAVNLSNSPVAVLNFWTRWATEPGYDYTQAQVSTDNGLTWTSLQGEYTHRGGSHELAGQPLYDGVQGTWVREQMVIPGYPDQDIRIRFTFHSDAGTTADGYYFDDVTVTIIDMTTGIEETAGKPEYFISEPSPNPAQTDVTLSFRLPAGESAELLLFDAEGKEVRSLPLQPQDTRVVIPVSALAPGVYYCRIEGVSGISATRKIIKW